MIDDINIKSLQEIIQKSDGSVFSDENIAIIVDCDEAYMESWEDEVKSLDVKELTDGEWSMSPPDDGDYGSIVLEGMGDMDVVKDDFDLGKHRFRKKF